MARGLRSRTCECVEADLRGGGGAEKSLRAQLRIQAPATGIMPRLLEPCILRRFTLKHKDSHLLQRPDCCWWLSPQAHRDSNMAPTSLRHIFFFLLVSRLSLNSFQERGDNKAERRLRETPAGGPVSLCDTLWLQQDGASPSWLWPRTHKKGARFVFQITTHLFDFIFF